MRLKGIKMRPALTTLLFLFAISAVASGTRNPAGLTEVPITGNVHQFNADKIEISYQKRIFIFPRNYAGFPFGFEPRPDRSVQIRFTLADWQKVAEKIVGDHPLASNQVDLREVLAK